MAADDGILRCFHSQISHYSEVVCPFRLAHPGSGTENADVQLNRCGLNGSRNTKLKSNCWISKAKIAYKCLIHGTLP